MSVLVVLCAYIASFLVTVTASYPQMVRLLFSTPTNGARAHYGPLYLHSPVLGMLISPLLPLCRIYLLRASWSFSSFEGTNDPPNIQNHPPHVIDYWFNLLGLSLDLALSESENLSSATTFPALFPPFNGISPYDSSLLLTLRHTGPFLRVCIEPERGHYSATGIPTVQMSPLEVSNFNLKRFPCPSPLPHSTSSVCEQNRAE